MYSILTMWAQEEITGNSPPGTSKDSFQARPFCKMCIRDRLKSLGLAGAAAAITAAFTYTVCRAILPCAEMNGTLTLVALKVKLSN